jgi:hypothetical protein
MVAVPAVTTAAVSGVPAVLLVTPVRLVSAVPTGIFGAYVACWRVMLSVVKLGHIGHSIPLGGI